MWLSCERDASKRTERSVSCQGESSRKEADSLYQASCRQHDCPKQIGCDRLNPLVCVYVFPRNVSTTAIDVLYCYQPWTRLPERKDVVLVKIVPTTLWSLITSKLLLQHNKSYNLRVTSAGMLFQPEESIPSFLASCARSTSKLSVTLSHLVQQRKRWTSPILVSHYLK